MQLFGLEFSNLGKHFSWAFIALGISCSTNAKKQTLETDRQEEEPKQQALGVAMNFADMANFSHYVNRSKLIDRTDLKGLRGKDGNASNFRVQGQKYGHYISLKTYRTKNWNKTSFDNFSMEAIKSHSVDAHKAYWKNFYISGTISDWEFQEATLENGWFNAQMKNCNFKGAYLKNVGFYGAKLTETHNLLKFGKSINFDGAVLENVTFKGSALKRASFKGTVFHSNIKFENANVHFVTQFAGAKFVDGSGKEYLITKNRAEKLDKELETDAGEKNITSDEIVKIIN